ncbi:MurR/RpiR family transcriptional regulator [Clostridium thermobutyricum]|uniref:MurR/RpiR family transcriptional regulator n=1 Tax=Clostridium thermobutyricum TaxID=29372 RepID=UPI0029425811|nr:MurR/RpiR family transcriptional regulator [Clostridium thermobutyricum]
MNKLNSLEVEIYKYILNNKEKVPYMTIRELSEEIHISTTSILRFCKKCGVEGFSEFKTVLKSNNNLYKIEKSFGEVDILDEFSKNLPMINKNIEEVAEKVKRKDIILFIGFGNSGAIASYGAKYMAHFDKFTISIDDPYYNLNAKALNNSVAIIISVSGENISSIEIVEKLRSIGVETISITNKKTSTLAKLTDYTINYYISREGYTYPDSKFLEYGDVTSQLPTIYIIERLSKIIGK